MICGIGLDLLQSLGDLNLMRYLLYRSRLQLHFLVLRAFLVLQQQKNLGRRFGTSKMHLSPPVA